MKTPEQIEHDFFETCYRNQRELIDAGKLDYLGLSEKNRKGIIAQCKEEAREYPELLWQARYRNGDSYDDPMPGEFWAFDSTNLFYSRIDQLPIEEESEEVAELKGTIKLLEKDLKEKEKFVHSTLDDLRKEKQLRSRVEENAARLSKEKSAIQEFVDSAAEDVEKYKGDVVKLEKKLSQQQNLAELADNRLKGLLKQKDENKKLLNYLERQEGLLENYRKEEASLYRDIRTLAMKLA